jgi:hypothetical protein
MGDFFGPDSVKTTTRRHPRPTYTPLTKRLGRFLLGDKRLDHPALIDPYEHAYRVRDG